MRWHVSADFLHIFELVRTTLVIDTKVGESEIPSVPNLLVILFKADTRSKGNKFEESTGIELFFVLGKAVEHLSCALGIAQVKDLLEARKINDFLDIGLGIVLAHLSPTIFPEGLVFIG